MRNKQTQRAWFEKAHQVIDLLLGAAAPNVHTVKGAAQLVGPVL